MTTVTTCKDPWTNPDTHADGTVEAMSTRLEERGANAAFAGMIEKYLAMVLPTAPAEPQPRFAVLDLGTGTGVVIRACAARLQKNGIPGDNVRLHGADISDKLLAQARHLEKKKRITWTKLDPADGGRLPYADGEFDVIVMHTLLSHVTDPVSTLRDAARCLKKRDGRLVVFDADHAGTVYGLPDFQKMMDTNLKLAVAIATQADICRQLPRYLRAAGLRLREHHAEVLSECGRGDYWLSSVRGFARLIPALGILPPEEGEAWARQMLQSHEDGTFFASGTFYTFVCDVGAEDGREGDAAGTCVTS